MSKARISVLFGTAAILFVLVIALSVTETPTASRILEISDRTADFSFTAENGGPRALLIAAPRGADPKGIAGTLQLHGENGKISQFRFDSSQLVNCNWLDREWKGDAYIVLNQELTGYLQAIPAGATCRATATFDSSIPSGCSLWLSSVLRFKWFVNLGF